MLHLALHREVFWWRFIPGSHGKYLDDMRWSGGRRRVRHIYPGFNYVEPMSYHEMKKSKQMSIAKSMTYLGFVEALCY